MSIKTLLGSRFKKEKDPDKKNKMEELAERSHSGELSGFAGIFHISKTTEDEKQTIEELLTQYKTDEVNLNEDLGALLSLTSEVKAINNQAIILHGERIKKAQTILKKYKDGAFTKWLLATYSNRQTPYNFLQYYELYTALPPRVQKAADTMPKQVLYSLSSRRGDHKAKEQFIDDFQGESKTELLLKLRAQFPLKQDDKRTAKRAQSILSTLERAKKLCTNFTPAPKDKKAIAALLHELKALIDD